MKTRLFASILLLACTAMAFGQTGAFHEATGDFYRVYSEVSLTHAQETADTLDAFLDFYNEYLHFDLEQLAVKLRVRIFSNKTNFDNYLSSLIPQKRDSFVFLQYKDLAKSELLGFYMDDQSYERALAHNSIVQLMKAYISDPPLWMQKGLAVYFEKSEYVAESQKVKFVENLAWVKTMKSLADSGTGAFIPLDQLLTISVEAANENIEAFYAESWALVSFLIDSNLKEYNRMMWDALSVLDADSTMSANSVLVQNQVFSWITTTQFYVDSQNFLASVKTFPELVRDGMASYAEKKYDQAESLFLRAIDRNEKHDIPYYYLGLINYARSEYTLAEYYYLTSQQMGGDLGLTYYALGVNSYADNRFDDAIAFLRKASEADPFVYGEKSQALLAKIEE